MPYVFFEQTGMCQSLAWRVKANRVLPLSRLLTDVVHCQVLKGRQAYAQPDDWLVDSKLFGAAPAMQAGSAHSPPEEAEQPPAKRRRSELAA